MMDDLISRAAAVRALASSNGDYLDALERIEKISAVDAVPVVHAVWKERRADVQEYTIDAWQSARCSACGLYHTTPYLYNFTDYKFCPNCGARMGVRM